MQVTINLLKRTTVFLFICFLIQEVISMMCILIFCVFLLDENDPNVDSTSITQLYEISHSFNAIFIRQLNSIQADLFLVYNHSKIFNFTTFDSKSEFTKSFENMLIKDTDFKADSAYREYENTDAIGTDVFMLFKHLKKKYESKTTGSIDEAQHIENLFNEIGLQYATYYSEYPSSITKDQQTSISYILSVLKAITIRDLNLQKLPNEYNIITENFFALYPPNVMIFNKGLNHLFYNSTVPDCDTKYLPRCLTYFKSIGHQNGQIYDNTVYFNPPLLFQNETIGQACINLPFNQDLSNFQSVICSKFEFNKIGFHIHLLSHAIDFALISIKRTNGIEDIELFYLIEDVYVEIQKAFLSDFFKKYALNNSRSSFSLFHLLYYHIFQHIDPIEDNEEFIDKIIEEYETNLQSILPSLKGYLRSIKGKDYIDNRPFQFNISQTYISYSQTQEGELYHSKADRYKDIFHYIITPVVLNTSNEKANTNRFAFFSFVVDRNEITVKKNHIYHLIAIKAANYFIFGIFLLLFIVLVFYFAFELYINYLLSPILKYKEDLLVILDNIPAYMKWTSKPNNKLDKEDLNSVESNAFSWENNSDICQYQNLDTKDVEYAIVFLKRILLMKYSDCIKYEEKANIYNESLIHLQKYPIDYIKCLFIVAINLFKSRKYPQAIEKLNDICNKLRSQIGKISINEEVKLSSNLSSEYSCYINEFFNLSGLMTPPARLSFNLHMMLQNCFYIIGLVDWVWFKDIKAKNKGKDSGSLDLNKKKDINQQIDYFLIDKGISAFINALEINRFMKANFLKNIWINLMVSKCEYEKEEYQKSNWHLQEAFVEVMDFNNYLINSNILVRETSVLMVNGLLLQCILYNFGKLLTKLKKYKTACEVFRQCLEISLCKIERIQSNCFIKISRLLKGKQMNESKILKKITQRLNPDYFEHHNKAIVILTSFEFINNYDLIEELKDALMKYTGKLFSEESDYFGYIEIGVNQTKTINFCSNRAFCEEFQRKYEASQIFTIDNSFNTQYHSEGNNNSNSKSNSNGNISSNSENTLSKDLLSFDNANSEHSSSNIYQGIKKSITMLNESNDKMPQDKYIFVFGISKFIDFKENEQWSNLRNTLHQENISLYVFCFENELPELQREKILNYIKKGNLIEGILFKVSSFKIIKKAFQNITTQRKTRVFQVCFNDVYNIY